MCLALLVTLCSNLAWAKAKSASELLDFNEQGEVTNAAARRGVGLSLDGFVGYYPRHDEIKLGLSLVLNNEGPFRPSLQVADNVVGVGAAWKLPLSVFADALSLSVGAAVSYDTARQEYQGSVYLARLVF